MQFTESRTSKTWLMAAMALLMLFSPTITGFGDEIDTLIKGLKDKDPRDRQAAASVLGFRKDRRAVEPLIGALKDTDEGVRYYSAWALGEIKDRRAVEPLTAVLKDTNYVRVQVARALEEILGDRAEVLMASLKNKDLIVIAAAYKFFIRRGVPGSEDLLCEAFREHGGDITMTLDFMGSGNEKLSSVGYERMRSMRRPRSLEPGHSGPRWGSARKKSD